MAGEISRLLFAPVSSASRSLTPTRNDATSTKTSNEEREKKRGGKKKKNKEKYTSVEKRARETDSAASSVITINCSPRDNYRWNGEGRGYAASPCFSAVLTYGSIFSTLPSLPSPLACANGKRWIYDRTRHTPTLTLSLSLPRLIRFAKRVYKLEHALVRGFLRVLLFIRARRMLQYYLHFHVESLVNFVLYVGKERDSFKSLRYFNWFIVHVWFDKIKKLY